MTEAKPWKSAWEALQAVILNPKLNDEALAENLEKVQARLPTPVFWLLGKAQSGKTSIIRALTGDERAQIGDGIRPCTRTAYAYDFPSAENGFLKFLDTRGLGEVDYNPDEDMALFEQQAHLLIVVMKAMDHAQQAVVKAVKDISKRHPQWPVIVVQTALHEGYPNPNVAHIIPHPYEQTPLPEAVPGDLARSLVKQRQAFERMNARFVAVDFTLPEDGYEPVNYGLDALWNAIEDMLPLGLRSMMAAAGDGQRTLKDVYSRAAHRHIIGYAIAAGGAGAIPVPLVGAPLVTAVQGKMFHTIASLYNQRVNLKLLSEMGGALGVSFLSNLGKRELVKMIPGYGAVISSLWTAATTYALGKTLAAYFGYALQGHLPDPSLLRELYAEQLKEGQRLLKDYMKTVKDKPSP